MHTLSRSLVLAAELQISSATKVRKLRRMDGEADLVFTAEQELPAFLEFLEHQLRRELELAFAVEDAATCGVFRSEGRAGTHKWRYAAVEVWILRRYRRAGSAAGQLSSRGDKGEGCRVDTENVCVIQEIEGVCPD